MLGCTLKSKSASSRTAGKWAIVPVWNEGAGGAATGARPSKPQPRCLPGTGEFRNACRGSGLSGDPRRCAGVHGLRRSEDDAPRVPGAGRSAPVARVRTLRSSASFCIGIERNASDDVAQRNPGGPLQRGTIATDRPALWRPSRAAVRHLVSKSRHSAHAIGDSIALSVRSQQGVETAPLPHGCPGPVTHCVRQPQMGVGPGSAGAVLSAG